MSVPPVPPASPSGKTSQTSKPAAGGIPKTVWDLVFTLFIPILILSPNIFGSGISVSEQVFGGGTSGNVYAYILAALIPVGYVAWDLIVNKNVSPVALIGGAGAVFTGALAFWFVDGFWYAIKDSARSYLIGLFFLISAATPVPLFKVFMDTLSIGDPPEQRQVIQRVWQEPLVHRSLIQASLVFAVVDFIGGIINSVVNYRMVLAKFGTADFNAQVAEVNAIMRLPGFIISLVGFMLAFGLVQKAIERRYANTGKASIMDSAKLAEIVEQDAQKAGAL